VVVELDVPAWGVDVVTCVAGTPADVLQAEAAAANEKTPASSVDRRRITLGLIAGILAAIGC
jgi:basic membrane lipoprotein Med (substrate-binding protein (PBP1-ABC) superfamily)